jgi:hypothetical protein
MHNDNGPAYGLAFYIPYCNGDYGQGALPCSVIWWECLGIKLDGLTRAARGPIMPGDTVQLSVEIGNSGTAAGSVSVSIYQLDPPLAFSPNLLSQGWIATFSERPNPGELRMSVSKPWQIKPTLPCHICLLVKLTSPLDMALTTDMAPTTTVNDRHYARLNVASLTVVPNVMPSLQFNAANPTGHLRRFRVQARRVSGQAIEQMMLTLYKEGFRADAESRRLGPVGATEGRQFEVDLEPRSASLVEAALPALFHLVANQFSIVVFE